MFGIHYIVPTLLLSLIITVPVKAQILTLERDSDRPGADYRSFDERGVHRDHFEQALSRCRAACAGDRRCLAYTFTLRHTGPGLPQRFRTATCWLKDAIPEQQTLANHVSGWKSFPQRAEDSSREEFTDPPGGVSGCQHFGLKCPGGLELEIVDGSCQCSVPRFKTPEEHNPQIP